MESRGRTFLLAILAILALAGGILAPWCGIAEAPVKELRFSRHVLSTLETTRNSTDLGQFNLSQIGEYKPAIELLIKVFESGPAPVAGFAGLIAGASISWYVFADEPIIINGIELRPMNAASGPQQPAPVKTAAVIDVLVVGNASQEVASALSGPEAEEEDINLSNLALDHIGIDLLGEYNLVILQGDPYADMTAREALKDYVNAGGKLIVIGDAGSKHPEYANVAGWSWPSGGGIPVPAEIIGSWAGYSDVSYGSDISWAEPKHPIAKGVKIFSTKTAAPTQVFKVLSRGTTIAAIATSEGTVPAIIEGGSGQGKVIYFSYDPGQTPDVLLNAIGYLAGM